MTRQERIDGAILGTPAGCLGRGAYEALRKNWDTGLEEFEVVVMRENPWLASDEEYAEWLQGKWKHNSLRDAQEEKGNAE